VNALETLNPQQREAVTTVDGPLLVLAGAGSGKTRVITFRIAYLIESCGVRPENVLAVTFTNKAAAEMRERVSHLIPPDRRRGELTVATFHSFCVRVLRRHMDRFTGYTRDFTIYDTEDQAKVVRGCMKDLGVDEKMFSPRTIQFGISGAKNRGLDAESLLLTSDVKKAAVGKVFKLYEERMTAANALDFDDLLLKTVRLLRGFPDIAESYNDRFTHILIDEYQDTNPPQFNLIQLLTQTRQNLCVVGDPDQSIYRFRAADIQNILDFEKKYPGAKTIKLTQNYRSTKTILDSANSVIKNNQMRREKDLVTENDRGEKIRLFVAETGEEEAEFVAREIQRWQYGKPLAETQAAVLYRTNAQSRLLEEACRRRNLQYVLVGGFSFYQRAEIKDIIAYLKLAMNLHDDMALERIINTPPRGIGKTTVDLIVERARKGEYSRWEALKKILEEKSVNARTQNVLSEFANLIEAIADNVGKIQFSELIKQTIKSSKYSRTLEEENTEEAEQRLLNLDELVSAAVEAEARGETLRDFIDHAALVADTDGLKEDAKITLMTIHSAKGLEFPLVFIVGMEEGLFPHSRSADDRLELEEERRLCYVALTRAKTQLYVTHAERRRIYGDEMYAQPSRFLEELPGELVDEVETERRGRMSKSAAADDSAVPESPARGRGAYGPPPSRPSFPGRRDFTPSRNERRPFLSKPLGGAGAAASGGAATPGGKFQTGDRVRHDKYGVGMIVKLEDDKLSIAFPGFGVKKFVESAVKLEKVR
jgi:DNA helicase II / ATP-dependent DNA helicase PcrA